MRDHYDFSKMKGKKNPTMKKKPQNNWTAYYDWQKGREPRLETRVASFADKLDLPQADFIYAGYSLPFCPPAAFDTLWRTIVAALRPGGRFAGQLFGVRDSWAKNPNLTFHTAVQVDQLLNRDLIVELLREREEDGEALKGPKHWHQFHIIARNRK